MFSFYLNIEILIICLICRELLMNLIKELVPIILHCIHCCAWSHLIQSIFLFKLRVPFLHIFSMISEIHWRFDFFVFVWVPYSAPREQ